MSKKSPDYFDAFFNDEVFQELQAKYRDILPQSADFLAQEYVAICQEINLLKQLILDARNAIIAANIKSSTDNLIALKKTKAEEFTKLYYHYESLFNEQAAYFGLTPEKWGSAITTVLAAEKSLAAENQNRHFIAFLENEISLGLEPEQAAAAMDYEENFLADKLALFNDENITTLLAFIQENKDNPPAIIDQIGLFFPDSYDEAFHAHFSKAENVDYRHQVYLIVSTFLHHSFGFNFIEEPQRINISGPLLNYEWSKEGSEEHSSYVAILEKLDYCNMHELKNAIENAAAQSLERAAMHQPRSAPSDPYSPALGRFAEFEESKHRS